MKAAVKKQTSTLTDAELRIMRVLWSRTESTVNEVVDGITSPRLARNTIMTMLGILERKGFVTHRVVGRTFVYRPLVDETSSQHRVINDILSRFFNNSPKSLVLQLIGSERISTTDLEEIRQLLATSKARHD